MNSVVSGKTRKYLSTLNQLALEFGWKCWYCGVRVVPPYTHAHGSIRDDNDATASLDHVVPKSYGGGDDYDNYALACSMCNRAKLDFELGTFMSWLERIAGGPLDTPIYRKHRIV